MPPLRHSPTISRLASKPRKRKREICIRKERGVSCVSNPLWKFFHQGKWIVPRTSFEMDFYLNPASIFSNGESNPPTESVCVHADDVKLSFYMCLVKLNPSTYMDMMGLLSKSAALYPFVRTEMRQYPLDNGATYKEINNPFNNKVPQRFVLAIVENSAFNGRYDQDTFAYQPAGIEYIKQIVDGENILTKLWN